MSSRLKKSSPELTGKTLLPVTGFLYTLDQIAFVLNVDVEALPTHVRFIGSNLLQKQVAGKENHFGHDYRMRANRITPSSIHDDPEWRITDTELHRYLSHKRIVVYERRMRYTPP